MSTGTSSPSHRYPEHSWVTGVLMMLRSNLENDVSGLAERLTNMARDYDAMQERNRTLQAENAALRRKLDGPPAEWVMDEPDTQDEAIRIACLMTDAYAARSPDEPIGERRARAAVVWQRENGVRPAASEPTP